MVCVALLSSHRHMDSHFLFHFHHMIDSTDRNFKGQMKHETLLCFCRKHWIVILHYLIGLPVLWAILIWFAFFGPRNFLSPFLYQTLTGFGILGATYIHHLIFIRIFNYYFQTVIVTNYRVISMDKTIFFRDSRNNIDVKEIQDVIMQKDGLLQTVLNYGDIKILLSSVTEPICLRCLPNPEYHFRKIHKTKREYIVTRQLEKETQLQPQDKRQTTTIETQSQVKSMPWETEKV